MLEALCPHTIRQIEQGLVAGLHVKRRRTSEPVVLAMIGLTGSGLSSVARELGSRLGWTVIEKNKIRVELRERGPGFKPVTTDGVFYAMAKRVLAEHGNAILDSDFADRAKRRRLERFVLRWQGRVLYLRVICERDVMLERILRARYDSKHDIFKSAAIAVREHTRRYPWHYRWSTAEGGRYTLRRPPTNIFAEVDTTAERQWKKRLLAVAERLGRL